LYSFIGDLDSNADSVQRAIAQAGDQDITMHINSPGGDVFEGFAIYNTLRSTPNKITVEIDGLAGSIATLIALAGDEVNMSEAGDFFIHNSSVAIAGNKDDLSDKITLLENIDGVILDAYKIKTGLDKRKIRAFMDAETHFTAKEAKNLGFIDNIVNPIKAVALLNSNKMKTDEQKGIIAKARAILGFESPEDKAEQELIAKMIEETKKKSDLDVAARKEAAKGGAGAEVILAGMVTAEEFQELKNTYTPLFKSLLNLLEEIPSTEQMEEMIKKSSEQAVTNVLKNLKSKTVLPAYQNKQQEDITARSGDVMPGLIAQLKLKKSANHA